MKRNLLLGVALVALVGAALATYSWAAAGVDSQTINACLNDEGKLRLVAAAGACKKAETPLTWNTVGPQGPVGPAGPSGVAGAAGRDGAPGGAGADPNAATGTVNITGQKQGAIGPIQLTGLTHEVISPRDPQSGLPTGKRMHKPFVITKELDKSSPLLFKALTTNENLTSVLIGLLRERYAGRHGQADECRRRELRDARPDRVAGRSRTRRSPGRGSTAASRPRTTGRPRPSVDRG